MKEAFRQSMAWLHTWAGLIFGWLLFAIFLTGSLSYFRMEITQWMQPEARLEVVDAGTAIGLAQRYLEQQAPKAESWFITLPDARQPAIGIMWVNHDGFVLKRLDPRNGAELPVRDSRGGDFLYRFHFELQMPYPWGRWLASGAAMLMFVALISGIITHKKIFKDFFTFRPRKGQRSWLDGHNAVGVLVLPFHLMITYSSLVIFMSMVMPAGILAGYGDRPQGFFNEVLPVSDAPEAAGQPGTLAPFGPMLEQARQAWNGAEVGQVEVYHPGDRNASVSLLRRSSDGVIYDPGTGLLLQGSSGQVLSATTLGSWPMRIAGGFYGLHMGHFATPILRWLYFFCGLAGTAMIGSGLVIWLGKRQLKHAGTAVLPFELRLVEVLNIAGMAGLVVAVGGFFWANRLLPVALAGRAGWEVNAFFIAWALMLVHAVWRRGRRAWVEQLGLAALLFAGLPLLDALTTDGNPWRYLLRGDWLMLGFDLAFVGCAGLFAWAAWKVRRAGLPKDSTIARRERVRPARTGALEAEMN